MIHFPIQYVHALFIISHVRDDYKCEKLLLGDGWDSMASKLRGVSGSSIKGKDIGKKISDTIKSLYEAIVKSLGKVKGALTNSRKDNSDVSVKVEPEDTRSMAALGFEPISVGNSVVYVNLSSDDDIFDDGPVFKKIETVRESESVSGESHDKILVSARTPKYQGLPVEPIQDSSEAMSTFPMGAVYAAGVAEVSTSSATDVKPVTDSTTVVKKDPVPKFEIKVEPASRSTVGLIVPELRRMRPENEIAPVTSNPTVIGDESEMMCITIPELMLDQDDISVGSDAEDMPDDGIVAMFPEAVPVKDEPVIDAAAEVITKVQPVVGEQSAEVAVPSEVEVLAPFGDSYVDASDEVVFFNPFTGDEVFDECYVDARRPVPQPVMVDSIDNQTESVPDDTVDVPIVDSGEAPAVTFSFSTGTKSDNPVVRFFF